MSTRPVRAFRNLLSSGNANYYSTKVERDARAQAWANRTGEPVVTELWAEDHPHDELNLGWASDGVVRPAVATVRLRIDNYYALYGTVKTEATATVSLPVPDDEEEREDWAQENLFPHTGAGYEDGDSSYDVEIAASNVPGLVGLKFEF